jgi:hypothetical protein
MKNLLFFIILNSIIIFSGCSVGSKGVFFHEMSKTPEIITQGNKLIIKTDNSIINSALIIYKIDCEIDNENNEILLQGFQSVNKEITDSFNIDFSEKNLQNLFSYKFFWVDPDKNKTELYPIHKQVFTGRTTNLNGEAAFIWDFAYSEAYYLEGLDKWDSLSVNKKIKIEGELVQFIEGKSVLRNWKILNDN